MICPHLYCNNCKYSICIFSIITYIINIILYTINTQHNISTYCTECNWLRYVLYTFLCGCQGDAAFWWNLKKSGEGDLLTRHAGCPVLVGSKWGKYHLICQGVLQREVWYIMHGLIPPCGTGRRENVGALYGAVSGLLAVISKTYPLFFSPVPWNIYSLGSRVVHAYSHHFLHSNRIRNVFKQELLLLLLYLFIY